MLTPELNGAKLREGCRPFIFPCFAAKSRFIFQVLFSSRAKACLKCPGATVLFGKFLVMVSGLRVKSKAPGLWVQGR
jgi:hypothetical protein